MDISERVMSEALDNWRRNTKKIQDLGDSVLTPEIIVQISALNAIEEAVGRGELPYGGEPDTPHYMHVASEVASVMNKLISKPEGE